MNSTRWNRSSLNRPISVEHEFHTLESQFSILGAKLSKLGGTWIPHSGIIVLWGLKGTVSRHCACAKSPYANSRVRNIRKMPTLGEADWGKTKTTRRLKEKNNIPSSPSCSKFCLKGRLQWFEKICNTFGRSTIFTLTRGQSPMLWQCPFQRYANQRHLSSLKVSWNLVNIKPKNISRCNSILRISLCNLLNLC